MCVCMWIYLLFFSLPVMVTKVEYIMYYLEKDVCCVT